MTPPTTHHLRESALWIMAALLFATAMVPFQTRRPLADGNFYIGTLHSLYVDGDVDLRDEAAFYPFLKYYTLSGTPPPNGLRNPFPIGTSLAWLPFYVAFDGLDRLFGGEGISESTGPRAGPVYFATSFWIVIGLWALTAALERLGARGRERLHVPAVLLLLSPLPAYITFAPDMSHGVGFAASAILLLLCVSLSRAKRVDARRSILCGLVVSAAALIRWQDALLGIVPALLLLLRPDQDGRRVPLGERASGLAWFSLGLALLVPLQLLAWKSVYDSWILLPGGDTHLGIGVVDLVEATHSGSGASFLSLANVEPFAFFFSTWNGAFLCHPILLLCLIGFASRRARSTQDWAAAPLLGTAVSIMLAIHVGSSLVVSDWWSGGSFGQRRFVSLLPFLAIGLLPLWRWISQRHSGAIPVAASIAVLLGLWNGLSLYRLHERSIPYNPASRVSYATDTVYEYYDYGRRARDTLLGAAWQPRPRRGFPKPRTQPGSESRNR